MLHKHKIARKNSDGMKRYYNRNTNFKEHNEGDTKWYLYLERKVGISPKLTRNWKFGDVLYQIQLNPRCRPKTVHYDKLKPYLEDNKPSWFRISE